MNRERARSPSPPPARSSKRRRTGAGPSLEVKLPIAVHVDETGGAVSIANTTNKGATQRAADIPHIGPSFRNRRGLLLRADSPYICQLCGEAFLHPADVKAHFNGHRDNPGHGCWEEHGSRPGVAWNDHRSCKISEDELRSVRCKEGWVIVDQESWDRINAAADAGRVFKAEKKAAKAAQETVEGAEEVEGTDSKPAEEPVSMVQKEPAGRKKAAGKKELPERKERPKRKVSLGTKVASEGKEAEGSKELPEPKDAPKRKVVRAGDETETDVGARKR